MTHKYPYLLLENINFLFFPTWSTSLLAVMKYISASFYCIVFLLSTFAILQSSAKVHVHIQNRQGKNINLHCRSKDDDLGYHNIENGTEYSWSFNTNFWGTTLFYCAVLMDPDPVWYHFDAYRQSRDSYRCESQCLWAILKHHSLIGYNQKTGNWERFFFRSDRLL